MRKLVLVLWRLGPKGREGQIRRRAAVAAKIDPDVGVDFEGYGIKL